MDPIPPAVDVTVALLVPRGTVGTTLVPKDMIGLVCVELVAGVGCLLRLLVTTPGLDVSAAIYCWAILACCLVVGSPLDGDHVLGAGVSGTGVLER